MTQPRVVTIVLNNKRRDDTLACLASLEQSAYENHRIIVLDNASTDDTVQIIRSSFPHVQVLELTENRGYAGNNNIGLKAALAQQADWVFVLNDDTIVDSGCLSELVDTGEEDQKVGIVGPMVYHYNEPGLIQSAGGYFTPYWEAEHFAKNQPDQGQLVKPRPVDWISGCAILVRREVIEQVGLLDERFFCYWEEIDWCLRASRSGWRIMHVPAAKIWHKGVQPNYQPNPAVTYYMTRNRFLMFAKHHAPLRAWIVAWARWLRTLVSWTIRPKWQFMHKHRASMWKGTLDFLYGRWGPISN